MKKSVFLIAGIVLLSACSSENDKSAGAQVSAIEANSENEAEYLEKNGDLIKEGEAEAAATAAAVTTLKIDKEVHDFGNIKAGSENNCTFKVTNTGTKPLVIESVTASCGCTTPRKPEKPIAPGKSDVIDVTFKPNGQGPSEKAVTIQANTDPKLTVVKVKAQVS